MPPSNWLERDDMRRQQDRAAGERHLADLREHHAPLISLPIRSRLPG
jgi:hypothetical protein